eukprot:TRINITY_DN773122_c0_g1_i1.p1 TRINITY_DN773122_c0_g1~~TRINITY_DN773122_c0_g1_i1.p1  ORF type:complete len:381 (-),score=97.40 TRINITY_DN773122_c0_g1_i1:106-1248(-)
MELSEANQPIVIDNGSGVLKAGFAGEAEPKYIFSNVAGKPKHKRIMRGGFEDVTPINEYICGSDAQRHRGILKIEHGMDHGIVKDWDVQEILWQYMYSKAQMDIQSHEHPVFITESPLNPIKNREKLAEIFFEKFNVPALFISPQAPLSLYASGKTTGIVLDCGDGLTHAVPVYEGCALSHAITRSNVAGREVTKRLQRLLMKSGHHFHTSGEFEMLREMKEQCCYVEASADQHTVKRRGPSRTFQLPDGNFINLGDAAWQATECLFQPHLVGQEFPGVHECVYDSIMACDLEIRKPLYESVILAGGTTLADGFPKRLVQSLANLNGRHANIKVHAPPERGHTAWVGGSILATLSSFKPMWVSKEQYRKQSISAFDRSEF